MYCFTKFLVILALILKFCLYTLYQYSLIVYYELITFLCIIDVSYLCTIFINYYYMYFIVKTHSVLCLLLSNDKFYIHSGGSLEY